MSKEEFNLDYEKAYEVFKNTIREFNYILAVNSALEKQIPSKPTPHIIQQKIGCGRGRCERRITMYQCPNCEEYISKTYKHCPDCGQALKWSDSE